MQQELLTVADVATALSVSQRQVWKLIAAGRLVEPVRIARSVRFRRIDIQSWISQGCPPRDEFEGNSTGKEARHGQ